MNSRHWWFLPLRCVSVFAASLVMDAVAAPGLTISWTNNLLTVAGPNVPGGKLDIWYLEAFCRSGSTRRDWRQTVLPHKTSLVSASRDGRHLNFLTRVTPSVEVAHEVRVRGDAIDFDFKLTNRGSEAVDVNWFQPACIRVERFAGRNQTNYTERSFIFTKRGLTLLAQTKRTEEALYRGGQVYVPEGINLADVNPRPLCGDQPVNGLIGCFSADDCWLMATAWDKTHELFEGVYVCLHADPHVGGLAPGKTKKIRGKLYLMRNDVKALLKRYARDFEK
jgi:hypothetical protein